MKLGSVISGVNAVRLAVREMLVNPPATCIRETVKVGDIRLLTALTLCSSVVML
jgi:hypothetical protein